MCIVGRLLLADSLEILYVDSVNNVAMTNAMYVDSVNNVAMMNATTLVERV